MIFAFRLAAFSLFGLLLLSGHAQGIEFFGGSWAEALDQARQQRKLIFVDAYTTWCGPCKMMNRNTFPTEEVGSFFNTNFVNVKLDMERGEGLTFSSRYRVNAYPTMFFINYQGEVVHRILGYHGPRELLREGRTALAPGSNLESLALAWQEGSTNLDTLRMLAMAWQEAEDRRAFEVADRYFSLIDKDRDLLLEENWQAMQALTHDLNSREYQYLLRKQKRFMRAYGTQPVADLLYSVLKKASIKAGLTRNEAQFAQVLDIAENDLKDDGRTAIRLQMTYFETIKDWESYAARASEYFERFLITQPKELYNAARLVHHHLDSPQWLAAALTWNRRSMAVENAPYNNLLQARLLAKTGNREEARRQAYQARSLAEQQGEALSEYDQFIRELERN